MSFINVLNKLGDGFSYFTSSHVATRTVLGGVAGRVVGVGVEAGMFQGLTNALTATLIARPLQNWLDSNIEISSVKIEHLNRNAYIMLTVMNLAARLFGPLLLTKYLAPYCRDNLQPYLPDWMKKREDLKDYTVMQGLAVKAGIMLGLTAITYGAILD